MKPEPFVTKREKEAAKATFGAYIKAHKPSATVTLERSKHTEAIRLIQSVRNTASWFVAMENLDRAVALLRVSETQDE